MPRNVPVDGRWPVLAREFAGRTVAVVGDVMLDRTVEGEARRLSPEAPVPVVLAGEEHFGLGGAGNVARNLASLGARALLCGAVGQDAEGNRVRELCREVGIDASCLLSSQARVTSLKTRFVAHAQQVLRVDRERAEGLAIDVETELVERLLALEPDALIVSDYAKGGVTERVVAAAVNLSRRRGVACVVDPKGRPFERYAGCTAITPNAEEAAAATGVCIATDADAEAAGRRLVASVGCEAVVVTRGRDGVSLVTPGQSWHLPAQAREVFDVTGAGDTLVAAFTLALACGMPMPDALAVANAAAGVAVQQRGVAVVTREQLGAALGAIAGRDAPA